MGFAGGESASKASHASAEGRESHPTRSRAAARQTQAPAAEPGAGSGVGSGKTINEESAFQSRIYFEAPTLPGDGAKSGGRRRRAGSVFEPIRSAEEKGFGVQENDRNEPRKAPAGED